jgi:hypothetical protein
MSKVMTNTNAQQEEFIRKLAEEIAYATYPEQTVMDDPEVIVAMIPAAERLTPFIEAEATRRERAAVDTALETLRRNLEPDLFGHDYNRLVDEIDNLTKRQALGEEQ